MTEKKTPNPPDRETRDPKSPDPPPAGPHDKPHLTDTDKTPGAGTLPAPGKKEDATSG